MSRIVLPALLKGIGGIGEMYAQANTQVVTNGFNAVTTRPETPDWQAETQRRIEARRQQQATEITPGEREYE